MNSELVISCALDIGQELLVSGAEVYRVEDCIRRIGMAYGAERVDVFTITNSILVTMIFPGQQYLTQTRRIMTLTTDLTRVDMLNQLSREMCCKKLEYDEVRQKLQAILAAPRYPAWIKMLAYGFITGAFTVFFGGGVRDAVVSFLIGIGLNQVVRLCGEAQFNGVISNLVSSFFASCMAILMVHWGLAQSIEMIVIGNIMPLIPGIGLTNSLRDMISGDTMTGLLRFSEACIMALAIAAGYILASMLLGGTLV